MTQIVKEKDVIKTTEFEMETPASPAYPDPAPENQNGATPPAAVSQPSAMDIKAQRMLERYASKNFNSPIAAQRVRVSLITWVIRT